MSTTPLLSTWSKQRIAEGRVLGKREGLQKGLQKGHRNGQHAGLQRALLLVLRSRGLEPSAAQRRRIERCTETRTLDAWLRRAAVAESVAQIFVRQATG